MVLPMLWIRGFVFTILVPGVFAYVLPAVIGSRLRRPGGAWDAGWALIAAGTLIYALCFIRFLAAGGTPAMFFSRTLRVLIGEEPGSLVAGGLYRFSRNPMYVGVLTAVFGQAILFASLRMAVYGCALFAALHIVVTCAEEPHLRATRGPAYRIYCRDVPRWLGLPHRGRRADFRP